MGTVPLPVVNLFILITNESGEMTFSGEVWGEPDDVF